MEDINVRSITMENQFSEVSTSNNDSTSFAQKQASSEQGVINGHEYVDLGLSVKWATCNLGASCPSDFGDYYAWGEIEPKSEYSEETSVTYGVCMKDIAGNPQYDAARANWGGTWRLPTGEEIDELIKKCKWWWTSQRGRSGYLIIGSNGNSIFLPCASDACRSSWLKDPDRERGLYWGSTPDGGPAKYARCLVFHDSYVTNIFGRHIHRDNILSTGMVRYDGLSIRPVTE